MRDWEGGKGWAGRSKGGTGREGLGQTGREGLGQTGREGLGGREGMGWKE